MSDIEINQISTTVGAIIIATALSGLSVANKSNQDFSQITTSRDSYIPNGSSPTFSENQELQKHSINNIELNNSFEQVTSQFYSELEVQQEPLGKEFEKVLYDNLWDLYES